MDLIGSPTKQTICFQGARGYNNGVYVLNDICKTLYSRQLVEARSVNLEDFESNLTSDGKIAKNSSISSYVANLSIKENISNIDTDKNTVTYVNGYYPILYKEEQNNKISVSDRYYTLKELIVLEGKGVSYDLEEELTIKNTYYYITVKSENYGDAYKALKSSSTCWMASRYVGCYENFGHFGLWRCSESYSSGNSLFITNGNLDTHKYNIRPVVHLEVGTKITTSETATNSKTPHMITGY